MISILDYGMGNTGSILNMIRKAGGEAIITANPSVIADADAIVLPGVGAFDNGMTKLRNLGLSDLLEQRVLREKTPFLGVCLGMQLLFENSEEGATTGLGWLEGNVRRFDFSDIENQERLKVPMMGWNHVNPHEGSVLFDGMDASTRFYFVHSYHVNCSDSSDVIATSSYGYEYVCAVRRENIFGVQFHPEKSHRFGLRLFSNFLEFLSC